MIGIGSTINQNVASLPSKKRKKSEYDITDDIELSPDSKKFRAIDPPAVFDRRSTKRKRAEEGSNELPRKRIKYQASGIFKRPRSPSLQREEPAAKKTKIVCEVTEDPTYNDFNYWRTPLPEVEDVIREFHVDMNC
jgi:hypothetical protein